MSSHIPGLLRLKVIWKIGFIQAHMCCSTGGCLYPLQTVFIGIQQVASRWSLAMEPSTLYSLQALLHQG